MLTIMRILMFFFMMLSLVSFTSAYQPSKNVRGDGGSQDNWSTNSMVLYRYIDLQLAVTNGGVENFSENNDTSDRILRIKSITKIDTAVFAAGFTLGAITWKITMYRQGDPDQLLTPGSRQILDRALRSLRYPDREKFLRTLGSFLKNIETEPEFSMIPNYINKMNVIVQPLREFLLHKFGIRSDVTYTIGLTLANMNYYLTRVFGFEDNFEPDTPLLLFYEVPREAYSLAVEKASVWFPKNIASRLKRIDKADVCKAKVRERTANDIARICIAFGLVSKT